MSSEGPRRKTGYLIVNADDWGRDRTTTQRTLHCFTRGAVSSASAMVFMEDSARAAAIARDRDIDTGLHLNLTTPFSAPALPANLNRHLQRLSTVLRRNRFMPVLFHPLLTESFRYIVHAQLEEFARLYGHDPERIDGHHHMHLCSNVLLSNLLPEQTTVRRNFSFRSGEKSVLNRWYRNTVDWRLTRRHTLADFFFALPPIQPDRLQRIRSCAAKSIVELETHLYNADEVSFLCGGELLKWAPDVTIAKRYITAAASGIEHS